MCEMCWIQVVNVPIHEPFNIMDVIFSCYREQWKEWLAMVRFVLLQNLSFKLSFMTKFYSY